MNDRRYLVAVEVKHKKETTFGRKGIAEIGSASSLKVCAAVKHEGEEQEEGGELPGDAPMEPPTSSTRDNNTGVPENKKNWKSAFADLENNGEGK